LPSGYSDEGRAMLQLVYDLAPGAELSFATAFTGEDEFAANIRALAEDGADIIVDDVIYFAEPFFQDGVVALAVDDVVTNDSVAYFSSAGNNAAQSYESDKFDGVGDTALDTILDKTYKYHDFNPNSDNTDTRQQIALGSNQQIRLAFQWDDPFYTNSEVDTDLDIFLIDSTTNQVVAQSSDDNIDNRTPYEYLDFTNTTGSSHNYDLVIGKYAGPTPGRIKYVNFGSDISPEYFSDSSTIYGHAAATNAEAVGAVPYYRQNTPESFTSLGPTTFFYEYQTDANGDPIAVARKTTPEIRQKPDLAAIDGTDTTFFGSPDFDSTGFRNFFGTSAAAPHAAAIAALLQQSNLNLTPEQIYTQLESTAIDISTPNLVGSGLVNAYDAIFGPSVNAVLNFTDNFEDGDLPVAYETNSTGAGRIQVTDQHNPNGTHHLTLDHWSQVKLESQFSRGFENLGKRRNLVNFSVV
jgi:Subtilase family